MVQPMWWRGRPIRWDPDQQIIEQERQRWVYERLESVNDLTVNMLATDPAREYEAHRKAYEETGDPSQLRLMLEYVREDG